MKTAALLLLPLLPCSVVRASTPPPAKSLAERVELATHVIVGTAKKVRAVKVVSEPNSQVEFEEIHPEGDVIQGTGEFVEVEIEVNETLYPLKWQAPKTLKYFFGGGWFSVKSVREDTVGKPLIYVMCRNAYGPQRNGEDIFTPSYGWHLAESLKSKKEIIDLIKERVIKEQAAK